LCFLALSKAPSASATINSIQTNLDRKGCQTKLYFQIRCRKGIV
jgi:hypothetical protein